MGELGVKVSAIKAPISHLRLIIPIEDATERLVGIVNLPQEQELAEEQEAAPLAMVQKRSIRSQQ